LFSISEIASTVKGVIEGDPDVKIKGVCDLQNSKPGYISYITSGKYETYFNSTKATAILVNNTFKNNQIKKTIIRVSNPALSFINIINMFSPPEKISQNIHPSSVIDKKSQLANNIEIGPHAVIESGVIVGHNVKIGANSFIGKNCTIGDETIINSNVSIYSNIKIGKNCLIDSGTVIGADGYGLVSDNNIHYKIPHIGTVNVGNDVWIGANCTIDRGTINNTIIGSGCKLDNLIHIAHNVIIGENCLMAAQVGIAGSTKIEDNVTIAGQVGIIGHLVIGENSIIASKSAVYQSLEANSFVSGIPARPHKNRLKQDVIINQLPDIINRFRKLENKKSNS
tara:strand:+ start:1697 stop:2713 length:1017 start_codon:yes stop_codon:yes gene_type:complete